MTDPSPRPRPAADGWADHGRWVPGGAGPRQPESGAAWPLLSASCGSSGGSGGTTITLYNGQHEQTTDALVKAFEKQTGIDVKVRNDDESVLVNQIETEGSASPADVIYTENSLGLEQLQEKHLLATGRPVDPGRGARPLQLAVRALGRRLGPGQRHGLQHDQLSPGELPKSVMDLALPAWKGQVGLAQGEVDFFPIVASIARTHGRAAAAAWLAGVKANAGGNVYPDNETLISEVNRGQVQIGIINHYYWYRQRAEVGAAGLHTAIATFAAHDPGYIIDVSGAGVLASSQEQAAAQRFVAFLVSRQGQEILAHSQSFEYPLGSGVTTAQPLPPVRHSAPSPLTVGELGDGATAIALLQQAGLA